MATIKFIQQVLKNIMFGSKLAIIFKLLFSFLVFFVCGKPMYKINEPQGNVMVDVSKCVGVSIYLVYI